MELIPQYFERRLACALICFQLLAGLPIVSAWMRLFGELCSCSVKSNFFFQFLHGNCGVHPYWSRRWRTIGVEIETSESVKGRVPSLLLPGPRPVLVQSLSSPLRDKCVPRRPHRPHVLVHGW